MSYVVTMARRFKNLFSDCGKTSGPIFALAGQLICVLPIAELLHSRSGRPVSDRIPVLVNAQSDPEREAGILWLQFLDFANGGDRMHGPVMGNKRMNRATSGNTAERISDGEQADSMTDGDWAGRQTRMRWGDWQPLGWNTRRCSLPKAGCGKIVGPICLRTGQSPAYVKPVS
jgi:hypothetical protein